MDEADLTCDALLGGAVRLFQPRRGHRAGTDAVLLAGLAELRAGDEVVDLGSASGAVGLMLAHRRADIRVTFAERDVDLVALCGRNIALNGLNDRAGALAVDVFAPRPERAASGLAPGSADLVVTNPPFAEADVPRVSPEPGRRAAHVMAGGGLGEWLACAADLLRHRGRLLMIHRADGLAGCLGALGRAFGSPTLLPVHPRAGEPATRIVVGATRGGRAPLAILPGLVLHEADGRFTAAAAALHAGLSEAANEKGRP